MELKTRNNDLDSEVRELKNILKKESYNQDQQIGKFIYNCVSYYRTRQLFF